MQWLSQLFGATPQTIDPWAAAGAAGAALPQNLTQIGLPQALQGLSPDMMALQLGMAGMQAPAQNPAANAPWMMNPMAPGGMVPGMNDPQMSAAMMQMGMNPNTGGVMPPQPQVTGEQLQGLAAKLAQQMPPPPPGSLEAMMKDPRMMQMMQGLQFKDRNREMELAKMNLVGRGHSAFLPAGMGSGSGMKVETPQLAQAALQQRGGRVPGLGEMLAGRRR